MHEPPARPRLSRSLCRSPLLQHPVAVGFALMVLFAAVQVLAGASAVILLGFLAVLCATLVSFPIDFLHRFMPRPVALVVTIVLLLGAAVGLGFLVVPVVTDEAARLAPSISVALERL
jgi:predicted PurR-regulated permease PerM